MTRRFKTQFNKRPVKDGHYPCDDLLEGDGIDPRYDSKGHKSTPNRKALQLCAQVFNALNLILAECRDEILQELHIGQVIPAPDSTQLLVTAICPKNMNPDLAHTHLLNAQGLIRTEIARSITRKRVPQLKFIVRGNRGNVETCQGGGVLCILPLGHDGPHHSPLGG